ncbi:MAG: hypothetical protein HY335_06630 [Deinococcus sp.]|nr:hypothetical protein [Deinococcus sp.]
MWLLITLVSSSAQESVLTEAFEVPTLPGWDHSPNAGVVAGTLRIEPGGFVVRDGQWGDLTLTMRVRRLGEAHLLIHYRASTAGSYVLRLGPGFMELHREAPGGAVALAFVPVSIPPQQWVQLRVSASQRQVGTGAGRPSS